MFKIAFQFMSFQSSTDATNTTENLSFDFRDVDHGFWKAFIKDNKRVIVSPSGDIRYVTFLDKITKDGLISEYTLANRLIFNDTPLKKSNYDVCMTLNGEEVVNEFIQHEREIQDFSEAKLGSENFDYYELGKNNIKIEA